MQFVEMYGYTQAGLTSGKRLQVEETFNWYVNNNPESSTQKLNLDAANTYNNEGKMTSVNYPSTFSYNSGGQLVTTPGSTYTYSFDAMYRPTGLTDQSNNTDVSNVTYNAANQLLGLNYLGTAETRQYNNLNQMTNLTVGSAMNITYTFPAGANNGKISQQTNSVSGETVTYQYDSLNRLLSATSSQSWSESYGYDGFGNLLSKTPTGGAPTLSQSVNAATNQIVGVTYDANGNQLTGGYGYDAENRLATATGIQYGYDSRNKRVWSGATSGSSVTQTVYFYGVGGQRLGIYSFTTPPSEAGAPQLSDGAKSLGVYFGGKRVGTVVNGATASFTQDRLGSNGSYYPYGEARGTVPQDDVGYATYTNDSATGLQYADQRYYASNFGRFVSPDPSRTSVGPKDPATWNRYSYTRSDPVNRYDPLGLQDEGPPQAPVFQVCPNGLIVFTSQPCIQGNAAAMAGGVILTQGFGEALLKAEQQVIAAAVDGAEALLAPGTKCSQFFTGLGVYNGTGQAMLQAYQQNGLIVPGMIYATSVAQVPYNDTFGAFSSPNTGAVTVPVSSLPLPGGSPGQMVNASIITINEFGFFFTGLNATGGPINTAANGMAGLDLQQIQELVILHELAHAAGLIPEDSGGTGASEANSQTIYNECFH
jgi:RHS repeat-associated protein